MTFGEVMTFMCSFIAITIAFLSGVFTGTAIMRAHALDLLWNEWLIQVKHKPNINSLPLVKIFETKLKGDKVDSDKYWGTEDV